MRMTHCVLVALLMMSTASSQQIAFDKGVATERSVDVSTKVRVPTNAAIDFSGFVRLSKDLEQVRQRRRVTIDRFCQMAKDQETIVLDTRSKRAFDLVHVAGAVHLNFSDFSEEKLSTLIPSKSTRILIYCNNNFKQPIPEAYVAVQRRSRGASSDTNGDGVIDQEDEVKLVEAKDVVQGVTLKSPALALNIPTFINLYGYGYKNVYELADQLVLEDPRLNLAGTEIRRIQTSK